MAGIGKCVAIMSAGAFVCGTTFSAITNARGKKIIQAKVNEAVQNGGMSQFDAQRILSANNKRAVIGSLVSGLFSAAVTAGISALSLLIQSKFFKCVK